MSRLLSLSVYWSENQPTPQLIDQFLFEVSEDWIRFNLSQWYLWTDVRLSELRHYLHSKMPSKAQFIIVEIEPKAAVGTAPQWVWDWLNAKMKQQLDEGFRQI